jgi:hypothetical protein
MIDDEVFGKYLSSFLSAVLGIFFVIIAILQVSDSTQPLGGKKEILDYLASFSFLLIGIGQICWSIGVFKQNEIFLIRGAWFIGTGLGNGLLLFAYSVHPFFGHGLSVCILSAVVYLFSRRSKRKKSERFFRSFTK